MPTENGLVPLREAAQRIGIANKTWRNAICRRRADLPSRPLPPAQQIGGRWYVKLSDLEAFISTAVNGAGEVPGEIESIAATIERIFPGEAQQLRELAPHLPATKRKLRRAPQPATTTEARE